MELQHQLQRAASLDWKKTGLSINVDIFAAVPSRKIAASPE
jgi:hypothetical protein